MNPAQKRTVRGVGLAGLLLLVWIGYVLVVEMQGIGAGPAADASISAMTWRLWAAQPWVIWLVSVVVAFVAGFFGGHLVAQSDSVYNDIRQGRR